MNYHLSGVLPLHGHACGGFAHWAEHAVGMVDMVQEKKTFEPFEKIFFGFSSLVSQSVMSIKRNYVLPTKFR